MSKRKITLAESEARLRSIIENAIDGIITIDERGIIESINPAAARLFQYDLEEVIGKNVKIFMPEPHHSDHDNYLSRYLRTGEKKIIGIGREVTGKRKDGSLFPLYLSIAEVNLDGQRIFTGIVHDLTEQKTNEERLRRYTSELERSNAELKDFAYVSSHDLQEPLRKIQAFGDRVMSKEYGNLSQQGKEYLDRMMNAASRMQRLINDLLSFSRVTTQTRAFKEVELDDVVREVLLDLEYQIEKKKASITFDKLPIIEGDETQLRQLFQNLIGNSLKFSEKQRKPVVEISSREFSRNDLKATPGDEMVEIEVKDNGIGFNEKYAKKIFHIFQRLEGHRYEGSGIGLAICERIANRHGGHISARSVEGEGATFIVTLAKFQTKEDD